MDGWVGWLVGWMGGWMDEWKMRCLLEEETSWSSYIRFSQSQGHVKKKGLSL